MPKLTRPRQKKLLKLQRKAFNLYMKGLTYQEVGDKVGRSHTWVMTAIRAVEAEDGSYCCGAPVDEGGRCSACKEMTR